MKCSAISLFGRNPQVLAGKAIEKVANILRRCLPRQEIQHSLNVRFQRRLLLVPVIRQAQREKVVGLDIKLPEEIFLPGREHLIVHRLDIRISHQHQHPKVIDITHKVGELLDHGIVAEVSPQNDLRHLEMIL